MGTQKLLLPYAGKTVIRHIVDQLIASSVQRVLVVVGADRERTAGVLADTAVTFIPNDDPNADMLSSVRCGLRAVRNECDGVLVALGDQPSISPAIVDQLIAGFNPPRRSIIVPTHSGRRGHPILFACAFRDEVLSQFDGTGLRGLLLAHPVEVLELETGAPSVLSDMDNPEDYRRELERLRENGN
jgi:molybdenum cofactor cytidylyltransferase